MVRFKLQIRSELETRPLSFDFAAAESWVDGSQTATAQLWLKQMNTKRLRETDVVPQPDLPSALETSPETDMPTDDHPSELVNSRELCDMLSRDPRFLFIDSVTELEPGVRAVAHLRVRDTEWFFPGHFPEIAIMPGMLQLEALIQTSTVALLANEENQGRSIRCVGVSRAHFKKIVKPGNQLILKTELVPVSKTLYEVSSKVWRTDDAEVLDARLTLSVA